MARQVQQAGYSNVHRGCVSGVKESQAASVKKTLAKATQRQPFASQISAPRAILHNCGHLDLVMVAEDRRVHWIFGNAFAKGFEFNTVRNER